MYNMFQMLLFIIYPTDICQMSRKYVQKHYAKFQHFTVCSLTVLSKLKALQLSKVGLSTIKHQHSKNLTPYVKMQLLCMSLFTKRVQNVHHLHGHMPGEDAFPLVNSIAVR